MSQKKMVMCFQSEALWISSRVLHTNILLSCLLFDTRRRVSFTTKGNFLLGFPTNCCTQRYSSFTRINPAKGYEKILLRMTRILSQYAPLSSYGVDPA